MNQTKTKQNITNYIKIFGHNETTNKPIIIQNNTGLFMVIKNTIFVLILALTIMPKLSQFYYIYEPIRRQI